MSFPDSVSLGLYQVDLLKPKSPPTGTNCVTTIDIIVSKGGLEP